jgi:hypothetical protein
MPRAMTLALALLVTALPVLAQGSIFAPAIAPPTRLRLLSAAIEDRGSMFEQRVLIDGCSIKSAIDSVTSGIGAPDSLLSALGGNPEGNCQRIPHGSNLNTIVKLVAISRGPSGVIPPGLPPDAYEGLYTVALRVVRRSGFFQDEQWVLRPLRGGRIRAVAMRVSAIGWSD